jgi:hypothetical protein
MSFDLEKIGVGEWFPYQDSVIDDKGEIEWRPVEYDEDGKPIESVCFRQVDPDEHRVIRDKYKGKKINIPVKDPDTRQMGIVPQYEQTPEQEKAERMEFWDKTIVDWDLKDPKGQPIPCTAENKYKLFKGHMPFLRFCNRSLQILSNAKVEGEKAAEKN